MHEFKFHIFQFQKNCTVEVVLFSYVTFVFSFIAMFKYLPTQPTKIFQEGGETPQGERSEGTGARILVFGSICNLEFCKFLTLAKFHQSSFGTLFDRYQILYKSQCQVAKILSVLPI